jgi:ABC-2 type transport system ATP-binding protein
MPALAIETWGLSRRFDELVAVDGIDLEVQEGEVFGFLGPNGAGKTTTVRMLATLISPSAGQGRVNGFELGVEDQQIRATIGILTETPGVYARLTAADNLAFFAKLQGVDDVGAQVKKYLTMLDLWGRRDDLAGSFSKGMRQKLAIARALIHEPKLVFLDEPTAALDPSAAKVVRDFIEELRGEGRTIFLCTHNLDEADRLCDRVAVFKRRLLRVATPAELRRGLYGRSVMVRLRAVTEDALAAVQRLDVVSSVTRVDEGRLRVVLGDPERHNPALVRALVEAGADVLFVEEEAHSLEEVYLDVVSQARDSLPGGSGHE